MKSIFLKYVYRIDFYCIKSIFKKKNLKGGGAKLKQLNKKINSICN